MLRYFVDHPHDLNTVLMTSSDFLKKNMEFEKYAFFLIKKGGFETPNHDKFNINM